MLSTKGFFSLKTPHDLLAKMEHDYQRIKDEPMDVYAAFDFFITAHSMRDWLRKSDMGKRMKSPKDNSLLSLCADIANGSKHFGPKVNHATSVRGTVERPPATYGVAVYGSSRYGTGEGLEIRLQGEQAEEFGSYIDADQLAEKVLAFWRDYLSSTWRAS